MANSALRRSTVALAEQCVRTVDALTHTLPVDVGEPLREGARADLAIALHEADAWDAYLESPTLQAQMYAADRLRARNRAAVMARALPGESYYDVIAREQGRD